MEIREKCRKIRKKTPRSLKNEGIFRKKIEKIERKSFEIVIKNRKKEIKKIRIRAQKTNEYFEEKVKRIEKEKS